MKVFAAMSMLSAAALVAASPMAARSTDIETLDYSGIKPAVYPPDGGCIIVARLYSKDNELRVYDSAPVCVPDAIDFTSIDQGYTAHPLRGVAEADIKWAAYGWIFPSDKSAASIGVPGCIWVDAKMDTDW